MPDEDCMTPEDQQATAYLEMMQENKQALEAAYPEMTQEWLGVLAQLWTGIGKSLDQGRLKIYRDQLKAVPLGLLELAVNRIMRDNTWSIVPPVGAIWQAIRKELGEPHNLMDALAEWHPVYRSRLEQEELPWNLP